jgi:starch phosphorylase
MKAAMNGAINVSILDGWWDEGYDGTNGWAVGRGEEYEDPAYQDQVESQAIYMVLENEIVPMFYSRGRDGLPRDWIRRMKNTMRTVCPVFGASRMVREYTERMYLPAGKRWEALAADGLARAKALAAWRVRIRQAWRSVAVQAVQAETVAPLEAGGARPVWAEVRLGDLDPREVSVALYAGPIGSDGDIVGATISEMQVEGPPRSGVHRYTGTLRGKETGLHGFRIRVLPAHPDLTEPLEMNCIAWG